MIQTKCSVIVAQEIETSFRNRRLQDKTNPFNIYILTLIYLTWK